MLRTRIITACVLLFLVLLIIYRLPLIWFQIAVALSVVLCAWEWSALSTLVSAWARVSYCVVTLLLLLFSFIVLGSQTAVFMILLIAFLWWLLVLLGLIAYERGYQVQIPSVAMRLVIGWLLLIPMAVGFVLLRELQVLQDNHLVLFAMLIVWVADTFAYCLGRQFGRRKLAVRISPGKTIAGVLGAFAGGVLVAALARPLFALHLPVMYVLGLVLLCVLIAITGDLLVSWFKRQAHVKDSGTLLPGHGGILDRMDSLIAAIPVFTLFYLMLGGAS